MSYEFELSSNSSRAEHTMLVIARANPSLLPECMNRQDFDCVGCVLANSVTCLLARDQEFASYLRYRISEDFRLRDVVRAVLKEHGRPMYWDIIASMVQARYPGVSKNMVYTVLTSYKADFIALDVGVYGLAGSHPKHDKLD